MRLVYFPVTHPLFLHCPIPLLRTGKGHPESLGAELQLHLAVYGGLGAGEGCGSRGLGTAPVA